MAQFTNVRKEIESLKDVKMMAQTMYSTRIFLKRKKERKKEKLR